MKLIRATSGAKRDPFASAPSKYWGTCGGARAVSRSSVWRRRTRAPKCEHVCTTGGYDVKDRSAHRRTLGWVMAHSKMRPVRGEPTRPSKTQGVHCVEGEISIVQSIQLGFSRSLGSANKSAMRRAKWTITARRARLRLAQMKYRYFVPECCKQNAIFKGTSHQNRSYLENISTNR